jgi:hypothetical protein
MRRKSRTAKAPERLRLAQEQFAAHLRNPAKHAAPADVEDRRMEIYRGLFFRNIRSFLSKNFPVLRKLHSDPAWDELTRDFYERHRSSTPLFTEIPREFLKYLQEEREPREGDLPFMLELAHYEWVELALSLDQHEIADVPADPHGDLLAGAPVLSPLAWPLSYTYPVHQIGPKWKPSEPPDAATHLLVYRNRQDQVRFMQLNTVSILLLQTLKANEDTAGLDILRQLANSLGHPDPEVVISGGRQLLEDFRERDVILGTRPVPTSAHEQKKEA